MDGQKYTTKTIIIMGEMDVEALHCTKVQKEKIFNLFLDSTIEIQIIQNKLHHFIVRWKDSFMDKISIWWNKYIGKLDTLQGRISYW